MNHRLVIRSEAETDLGDAYDWYEKNAPGRGEAFLFSFNTFLSLIDRMPNICRRVRGRVRKGLMRRYPYRVFYAIRQDAIVVLGVVHAAREIPEKWRL